MKNALADEARSADPERFTLSLFYPEKARPPVWALLAFYGEIARIPERVSEETLGMMRLAWWRQAIDEAYGGESSAASGTAQALGRYIEQFAPPRLWFDAMLEAREEQLHAPRIPDQATFERFALSTSGMLAQMMLRTTTADAAALEESARLGALYGRIGLLRSAPHQLRHGYLLLPEDRLNMHGLSAAALQTGQRDGWHEYCNRCREEMLQECTPCRTKNPLNYLLWSLCRLWLEQLQRTNDPFSGRFPPVTRYLAFRLAWKALLTPA